jgi:hypothetical protein
VAVNKRDEVNMNLQRLRQIAQSTKDQLGNLEQGASSTKQNTVT